MSSTAAPVAPKFDYATMTKAELLEIIRDAVRAIDRLPEFSQGVSEISDSEESCDRPVYSGTLALKRRREQSEESSSTKRHCFIRLCDPVGTHRPAVEAFGVKSGSPPTSVATSIPSCSIADAVRLSPVRPASPKKTDRTSVLTAPTLPPAHSTAPTSAFFPSPPCANRLTSRSPFSYSQQEVNQSTLFDDPADDENGLYE